MAELQGNITILMFKDGDWSMNSGFTKLSTIKILSKVIEKLAQDLEQSLVPEQPTKPSNVIPILPDKYRIQ